MRISFAALSMMLLLVCTGCARAPAVLVADINAVINTNVAVANTNPVVTNTNAATPAANTNTAEQPRQPTATAQAEQVTTEVQEPQQTEQQQPTEQKQQPQPEPRQETAVRNITIDMQVVSPGNSTTYRVAVAQGSTVADLMEAARAQGLAYKTKGFSGLGQYIKTINGLSEDTRALMYWILYYNGSRATAGMSQQTLTKGDTIKWNYEHSF